MNRVLRSSRLELRPCAEADTELLLTHWIEPAVRRYMFDDRVVDGETVRQFIAASAASFQRSGYGLWVLISKADGGFRGVCGLCETIMKPDLLFSVEPPYWGQGLATEGSQCVLRYAFDVLGLRRVTATVDKPNTESVRVLEKLGMSLTEVRLINGNPILCYALAYEDYRMRELA